MSFNLSSTINEFTKKTVLLQTLIDELNKNNYSIYELNNKNNCIKNNFDQYTLLIDNAEALCISLNTDEEIKIAKEKILLNKQILNELQLLWSKVITSSTSKIKLNDQLNRNFILSGYNDDNKNKNKTVDTSSQKYTSSLIRTKQLLSQELERSNQSLLAFEKSTDKIKNTLDEYSIQTNALKIGHRIMGKLKQRDFTDRLLLAAGLLFVILVALSIVWSRLAPFLPAFTSFYAFTTKSSDDSITNNNPLNMASSANLKYLTPEVKNIEISDIIKPQTTNSPALVVEETIIKDEIPPIPKVKDEL